MKKFTTILATTLLTASMGAIADGGYLWEKKLQSNTLPHYQNKYLMAREMQHSAVEHKRWMVDDAQIHNNINRNTVNHEHVAHHNMNTASKMNHSAVQHKRWMVDDARK